MPGKRIVRRTSLVVLLAGDGPILRSLEERLVSEGLAVQSNRDAFSLVREAPSPFVLVSDRTTTHLRDLQQSGILEFVHHIVVTDDVDASRTRFPHAVCLRRSTPFPSLVLHILAAEEAAGPFSKIVRMFQQRLREGAV